MNLNGVGTEAAHAALMAQTKAPPGQAEQSPTPDAPAAQTAAGTAEDGQKAKGVIRNLMAGHYKGVAGVRLRINFNEELSAISEGQAGQALAEGMPALLEAVAGEVDALLAATEMPEEQASTVKTAYEAFANDAAALMEGLQSGETSAEQVMAQVKTAFQELTETLSPLLMSLAEAAKESAAEFTEAVQQAASTDGQEAEGTQSPLASGLQAAFENAFAELEASVRDAAATLPELTPPTGNGVAYERFAAMYSALQEVGAAEQTGAEPAALNQTA